MSSSPEILTPSSLQSLDAYSAKLHALDARAQELYEKIQAMPKDMLDLPQMRKVISLMLDLKKRLTPEETVQTMGETASKMPVFVEAEDKAGEALQTEVRESLKEGHGLLTSMKDIFANAFAVLTKIVKTLFHFAEQHPKIIGAIFSSLVAWGSSAAFTGFVNSIMAGGGENASLMDMVLQAAGFSEAQREAYKKDGLKGLVVEWGKDKIIRATASPEATAVSAIAGAKLASNIAGKSIAPLMAESSTALRALGLLGSRLGAIGLLMTPTEMGNGELPRDQIRQATPEEYAKTMQYINSLPKAK